MAIITRQTGLLAAEDWKKIYQTFKEADFTSYDYETLRKSMIDYIRTYYPEDFNDYTESSEFIALIDLIAFLGQSLAFRADLNARENFIDTAERRDSILKLARLVSYNPKRSIPASGFLKVDSVSTTEDLLDTDGISLTNTIVNWNDPANDNWQEQFSTIINAALINMQIVGKPANSQLINGIQTDEYNINLPSDIIPAFRFEAPIDGSRMLFEAVSASSINNINVYEVAPNYRKPFNLLFRNDYNGNSSNNTGYFFHFKQGQLDSVDFSITDSIPNRVVNIDIANINNDDLWLYAVDSNGIAQTLWRRVPATSGINVVYNNTDERNLYQVNSRAGEQVSLVFGDGAFSNIPQGNFRLYYRVSNGLTYRISPDEIQSIPIAINYISRKNRTETITFRVSLKYTVANALARETTEDVRQRAPQQYYTQNRMVTGEDYNIFPYSNFSNIIKTKSINRTSAGLSKYLDVLDSSGKYSSTNVFGEDGAIYRNEFIRSFNFSFTNKKDIEQIIYNKVINEIIASRETMQLYYSNLVNVYTTSVGTLAGNLVVGKTYIIRSLGTTDFTLVGAAQNKVGISFVATGVGSGSGVVSESYSWNLSTSTNNNYTGYFVYNNLPFAISSTTANNGRYLDVGSIVKFVAPPGYYFNSTNNLIAGTPTRTSDIKEIFATILNVRDSGTNSGLGNYSNGVGPVVLNNLVPTGALIEYIIPSFKNNLNLFFVNSLVSKLSQNLNVGIFFNNTTQNWEIVNSDNISTNSPHNWFVKFEYNNALSQYVVSYRGIEFVFHSPSENVFYFDEDVKIYDSKNAKTIKDNIKVLKINNDPNLNTRLGNDLNWDIYKKYLETDGYTNNTKIYITYSDSDQDGVPDDPRSFELLVNPQSSDPSKYIFFKSSTVQLGVNRYVELLLVPKGEIIVEYPTKVDMLANAASLRVGQVLYATNENLFYSVVSGGNGASNTISQNPLTNYQSYIGRQDLYYQYKHNSPNTRRINPSLSNIIDIYILTSNYDLSYREWITDSSNKITEPTPPTTNELELEFQSLNNFKTISDSLLMQTATYKPLFGNKADNNLQATFKIVKNPNVNVSDSDVKTSVISAINTYFQIENWDFGETFYFSELSAYLHRVLSPNIASIVIVPKDPNIKYGVLHQINAEPYEILISAATVDDVEIISAVTANQLNQGII